MKWSKLPLGVESVWIPPDFRIAMDGPNGNFQRQALRNVQVIDDTVFSTNPIKSVRKKSNFINISLIISERIPIRINECNCFSWLR